MAIGHEPADRPERAPTRRHDRLRGRARRGRTDVVTEDHRHNPARPASPSPAPRTNAFAHTWGLAMVTAEATSGNQGPRPDRPSRMKPYVGGLAMALLLATCTNAGEGSTANQGGPPREGQATPWAETALPTDQAWAPHA